MSPASYSEWLSVYPKIFGVSFAVSAVLTALSIPVLRRLGIMDKPTPEKIHLKATPRMGGPPIWIAMALALWLFTGKDPRTMAILGGGLLVLVMGMCDDVRRVNAVVKLLYLAGATWVMFTRGVATSLFPVPWLNLLITIPWVLAVTSAFNATDNMDGLAGGLAFIAACLFVFVGIQMGTRAQLEFAGISAAMAGAVLGFLVLNRPPARIFLGDSGAFFLGYTLAAVSVMGGWSTHPVKASLVPILILSVPLLDLAYVILARWYTGKVKGIVSAIVYCGQDHISHRLVALGFSRNRAVLFILTLALAVGILAVALRNSRPSEAMLLALQVGLIYALVFTLIKKARDNNV